MPRDRPSHIGQIPLRDLAPGAAVPLIGGVGVEMSAVGNELLTARHYLGPVLGPFRRDEIRSARAPVPRPLRRLRDR